MFYIVVLLISLIPLTLWLWTRNFDYWKLRGVPGPTPSLLYGNTKSFWWRSKDSYCLEVEQIFRWLKVTQSSQLSTVYLNPTVIGSSNIRDHLWSDTLPGGSLICWPWMQPPWSRSWSRTLRLSPTTSYRIWCQCLVIRWSRETLSSPRVPSGRTWGRTSRWPLHIFE